MDAQKVLFDLLQISIGNTSSLAEYSGKLGLNASTVRSEPRNPMRILYIIYWFVRLFTCIFVLSRVHLQLARHWR